MAWDTRDALEALTQAMQVEVEGRDFYLKAADRTQDQSGKAMFRSLAADETEHYAKLKKAFDHLSSSGQWLRKEEMISRPAARWAMPEIFPVKKAGRLVSAAADDVEALQTALKAERASYDAYAGNRDKADDPDAKALFAYLAEEERGHYEILDAALQYLGDTASFFLIEEKAINEG